MNLSRIADKTRPDYFARRVADLEKRIAQLEGYRASAFDVVTAQANGLAASSADRTLISGSLIVPAGFTQALVYGFANVYATLTGSAGTDLACYVQIAGGNGLRANSSASGTSLFASIAAGHTRIVTGLNTGASIGVHVVDAEDVTSSVLAVSGNLCALAVFLR